MYVGCQLQRVCLKSYSVIRFTYWVKSLLDLTSSLRIASCCVLVVFVCSVMTEVVVSIEIECVCVWKS